MALTKTNKVDKIEIVGDYKMLQIREVIIIEEDGNELSRSFHRRVVTPACDITSESQEVKDICAIVHTQEIKDSYDAFVQASTI